MKRVVEDIDEGLAAAIVYELSKLGVKKATRRRIHPLENKIVIEADCDQETLREAIANLKSKLREIKEQICK